MNFIFITTQKAMMHYYPTPPADVRFLQNTHRHLFKFKVWIEVFHNERDLEFFLFQNFVEQVITNISKMGAQAHSCEAISDLLFVEIAGNYCTTDRPRKIRIEVSEDGENGSYKEY